MDADESGRSRDQNSLAPQWLAERNRLHLVDETEVPFDPAPGLRPHASGPQSAGRSPHSFGQAQGNGMFTLSNQESRYVTFI
jgi:hypothetical protein